MSHPLSDHRAEHGFDTSEPIALYVENPSGTVTVAAVETATSTVHIAGRRAEDVIVSHDGDHLSVIAPKNAVGFFGGDNRLDIAVRVPADSALTVKSGSADLTATGRYDDVRVKSGSGDVEIETVGGAGVIDTGSGDARVATATGELRVRSGSGAVVVDQAEAATSVSTGSGDVRLGRTVAAVVVKTGSGDLEIVDATGDVAMNTGSGSTVVRSVRRGRVSSKGASGDVRIGVPQGTPVWTDISTVTGHVRSGLASVGEPEPCADHVELRLVTVSGDIVLAPA